MNDPHGSPVKLLYNEDISLSISRRRESMPFFFRNADGDELHFIHKGGGRFESDFGAMSFEVGDYILVPKGTNYRFVYDTNENFSIIVESRYAISFPIAALLANTHHLTTQNSRPLNPIRFMKAIKANGS